MFHVVQPRTNRSRWIRGLGCLPRGRRFYSCSSALVHKKELPGKQEDAKVFTKDNFPELFHLSFCRPLFSLLAAIRIFTIFCFSLYSFVYILFRWANCKRKKKKKVVVMRECWPHNGSLRHIYSNISHLCTHRNSSEREKKKLFSQTSPLGYYKDRWLLYGYSGWWAPNND